MKYLPDNQNGTFEADEIMSAIKNEEVDRIGNDVVIVKTTEPFGVMRDYRRYEVSAPTYFIVYNKTAYPFDVPFVKADKEGGVEEQVLPETWEDALSIIEGFGR